MECRITDEECYNPWEEDDEIDELKKRIFLLEKELKVLRESKEDVSISHYNFQNELITLKKDLNHANFALTCIVITILLQAIVLAIFN